MQSLLFGVYAGAFFSGGLNQMDVRCFLKGDPKKADRLWPLVPFSWFLNGNPKNRPPADPKADNPCVRLLLFVHSFAKVPENNLCAMLHLETQTKPMLYRRAPSLKGGAKKQFNRFACRCLGRASILGFSEKRVSVYTLFMFA